MLANMFLGKRRIPTQTRQQTRPTSFSRTNPTCSVTHPPATKARKGVTQEIQCNKWCVRTFIMVLYCWYLKKKSDCLSLLPNCGASLFRQNIILWELKNSPRRFRTKQYVQKIGGSIFFSIYRRKICSSSKRVFQ